MKPRRRSKAIITRADGMSVGVRGWLEPWKRGWSLPGGGIDGTETPEEALWRELNEEIGLEHIDDFEHSCTYLGAHTHWVFYIGIPYKTVTHLFEIRIADTIPLKATREIRDAQWLDKHTLAPTLHEYRALLQK